MFLLLILTSTALYSVSTFNFEQVFVSRVWKTSQNVLKTQKQYICFIIRVARPISFSDLSLHRIEINYEQMTILWSYYEYNMNICFTSKFAPGIPSVLALIRSVFWIAVSQRFNIFLLCQTENLFKSWNKLQQIGRYSIHYADNWAKYLQIMRQCGNLHK